MVRDADDDNDEDEEASCDDDTNDESQRQMCLATLILELPNDSAEVTANEHLQPQTQRVTTPTTTNTVSDNTYNHRHSE